MIYYKYIYY